MIFDNIKNAHLYYGLNEKIKRGFEWIINTDLESLDCGRHEISDSIYANVQELTTKLPHEAKFEAHRKYIDIQYVIKGSERMDFSSLNNLETAIPYDSQKDVEFLKINNESYFPGVISVTKGYFAIFFPEDAHAPMLACNECEDIKKVIVKIKAD